MPKKVTMTDVRGYPIFEVGTWNGMTFTDEDLEDIANNFAELAEVQKVPLKLGHNDEQQVTDGKPALGWVTRVRKIGKQLIADFESVPSIIKDAIARKLYRAVSIELLLNVKRKDKTFKHVLDAVAILGADAPAVYTLPDLDAYLASRSVAFDDRGRRVVFETMKAGNRKQGAVMEKEEVDKLVRESIASAVAPLKEQISEFSEQNKELRTKVANLETENEGLKKENKTFKSEKEDAEKETRAEAVKLARKNATKVLEDAVKAKKITPAQREKAISMFGIDDDDRVVKLELDDIREYYSLSKEQKSMNEDETSSSDPPDGRKHKDVFKEVDYQIRMAQAKDPKLSYKDASRVVFTTNPELHREYINTNTPEQLGDAA